MRRAGLTFITALFSFTVTAMPFVHAATVDELKSKIDSKSNQIKQLEEEIVKFQGELNRTATEAKNLQSAVKELDVNAKKLSTDLKVTENKIDKTNLTIQQLSYEITDKQERIKDSQQALANAIRSINEADNKTLLETMISYNNLSEFWNEVDTLNQFQIKVQERVDELRSLQAELLKSKLLTQEKKNELLGLKNQLADQKTIVEINKDTKAKLLKETKNLESGYKKLIQDRVAQKEAFEKEMFQLESQLKIAIDPKSIPTAKSGVLAWPLKTYKITQYFGNTAFARANAGVYNGQGHNGIDLGVPIGTPVYSAESGVVLGAGDTDTFCPRASYGKWVLIKHNNGLSTLYAHLSVIKVSSGNEVNIGDIIGYSGNTGYSTGPHLHFTVYASQGVQIMSRKSAACGSTYIMPVADLKAYLNPLSFL